MTANEVVTEARVDLADSGGVRWSNNTLVTYVSDGQLALMRKRPSLMLEAAGSLQTVSDLAGINSVLKVDATWRAALVHYVVHRALLEDDADTENLERAATRLGMFLAAARGEE